MILPGMTASVSANLSLGRASPGKSNEQNQASFYLPSHTVLKDAQGNFVFVVLKHDLGVGKIVRKSVVIGDITAQGIEVFAGLTSTLSTGDYVISAGMSKISSGSLVKFTPASDLISH